jgi:8-oxo-dGTP diphosphatase
MKHEIVACGIIKKDNQILLVKHNSEKGSREFWTLPGGVMELGETIHDGLIREIKEETGLVVNRINSIAYSAQKINHIANVTTLVYIFDILAKDCDGEIETQDPDGDILDIGFFSIEEAIEKLSQIPFRIMSEPVVKFLKLNLVNNPFWSYVHKEDGSVHVIEIISE